MPYPSFIQKKKEEEKGGVAASSARPELFELFSSIFASSADRSPCRVCCFPPVNARKARRFLSDLCWGIGTSEDVDVPEDTESLPSKKGSIS